MADYLLPSLFGRLYYKNLLAGQANGKIFIGERIFFGVPSKRLSLRPIIARFYPRVLFGV
jgi:hypothetical protein